MNQENYVSPNDSDKTFDIKNRHIGQPPRITDFPSGLKPL